MTKILKATLAVLAVLACVSSATAALATPNGSGIYQACEDNEYTPHGIWDCR